MSGFATLVLSAAISLAADLPRDPDYDYDPPVPGSYTFPVVKAADVKTLLLENLQRVPKALYKKAEVT